MKTVTLGSIFIIALMFAGCYYDKEELLYPLSTVDCGTISAKFADVAPIIAQKCAGAGCHDAATAAGATVLETYDQIKARSGRINQRVIIEKTMPPGTSLTPAEMATLKCWMSSGMPAN